MKLLIDANVILDVLEYRMPYYEDSRQIVKLCEAGECEGVVSALTFANIVYIMRKRLDAAKIQQVHEVLSGVFTFLDLTAGDISEAAGMKWHDFEDAVQTASAKRVGANCIITRNVKDFVEASVPCLTPAEFIERM